MPCNSFNRQLALLKSDLLSSFIDVPSIFFFTRSYNEGYYNILLTIFPMLYFTSPWLFCNFKLVLLNLLVFLFYFSVFASKFPIPVFVFFITMHIQRERNLLIVLAETLIFVSHFSKCFIKAWSMYKQIYIFNVYNLMSLEVCIHLWNHHHVLCHRPSHHLQKLLPSLVFIIILCVCDKNTR